jgi:uncharacterized protein YciI
MTCRFTLAALALGVAFLGGTSPVNAQSPAPAPALSTASGPQAPPEFGPTSVYTIAFLKRGPKWTPERTEETARLQEGHMAHIRAMWDEGILIGAGPFQGGGDLRGIFLFGPGQEERARKRSAEDPTVLAGRLALEIHPWMGPKGIGDAYREWVKQNPGKDDEMVTLPFALLRRSPGARASTPEEQGRIMAGHLGHILAGARTGKLLAAGPILDGGALAGLLFYAPGTAETEARAHADGDPAVVAGWFTPEFHNWMVAKAVLPAPWAVKPAEPK